MVTGDNIITDNSILYWCFKKLTFCSKHIGLDTKGPSSKVLNSTMMLQYLIIIVIQHFHIISDRPISAVCADKQQKFPGGSLTDPFLAHQCESNYYYIV